MCGLVGLMCAIVAQGAIVRDGGTEEAKTYSVEQAKAYKAAEERAAETTTEQAKDSDLASEQSPKPKTELAAQVPADASSGGLAELAADALHAASAAAAGSKPLKKANTAPASTTGQALDHLLNQAAERKVGEANVLIHFLSPKCRHGPVVDSISGSAANHILDDFKVKLQTAITPLLQQEASFVFNFDEKQEDWKTGEKAVAAHKSGTLPTRGAPGEKIVEALSTTVVPAENMDPEGLSKLWNVGTPPLKFLSRPKWPQKSGPPPKVKLWGDPEVMRKWVNYIVNKVQLGGGDIHINVNCN